MHSAGSGVSTMKHTIYQDRITHKFAVIRLPAQFVEGEAVRVPPNARWFETREEALATLSDLFDQDEEGPFEDRLH
jgi:hypothetical protein